MSLFAYILKLNDFIIDKIYLLHKFFLYLKPGLIRIRLASRKLPRDGKGKELIIVLNGPSIKKQQLVNLKNKTSMFVNRGFLLPEYKEIQPNYHVFVDSKLRDGIWPVTWLDDIVKMCPNIRIILPLSWYNHPTFFNYKKSPNIYWLPWELPFLNLGVSGGCFSYAIYNQFDKIYFTGFDGDYLFHEILKHSETHFYGNDTELSSKTTKDYVIDLFTMSRHFHDLNRLRNYADRHSLNIYNLTEGGLLDMFERKSFDEIVNH